MNTRFLAAAAVVLGLLFNIGCASLDQKQREWIFQPSDRAWGGSASEPRAWTRSGSTSPPR
jgi:hypothetical protein